MLPVSRRGDQLVITNRKARHDYLVLDTIECGLVLVGSEVKSLRDAKVQLGDAYARVERGELWLHNMHIAAYEHAAGFGAHVTDRPRKLLAHRGEIERLGAKRDGVIRRQSQRRDGTLRDTVMYSVTDDEWRGGIRERLSAFLGQGTLGA